MILSLNYICEKSCFLKIFLYCYVVFFVFFSCNNEFGEYTVRGATQRVGDTPIIPEQMKSTFPMHATAELHLPTAATVILPLVSHVFFTCLCFSPNFLTSPHVLTERVLCVNIIHKVKKIFSSNKAGA